VVKETVRVTPLSPTTRLLGIKLAAWILAGVKPVTYAV
jgi:hypothetical protein